MQIYSEKELEICLIPNQYLFWCKSLHYHDPKTKFSEKDTKYFLGRNMPKLPYFEGKKSLKLTYWLLKFGSFLLQMIRNPPTSPNWKEKRKRKTTLLTT
jgi:hypothetical protein